MASHSTDTSQRSLLSTNTRPASAMSPPDLDAGWNVDEGRVARADYYPVTESDEAWGLLSPIPLVPFLEPELNEVD